MKRHLRIGELIAVMLLTACAMPNVGDDGDDGDASDDEALLVAAASAVNAGTLSARFASKLVPTTMVSGRSYGVWIEMKNTGTATWTPDMQIKLGAQNPRDNITWANNRVRLFRPTKPGQTYTFNFTVVAPAPGVYNFQWQMLQELVTWFGEPSPNVVVHVTPSPSKAFGPQLLANSGFERRTLSPWGRTAEGGTVVVEPCCGNLTPGGSWNAKIVPNSQGVAMYQEPAAQVNRRYELRARVALGWKGMRARVRWAWFSYGGVIWHTELCQEANSQVSWPNFQDLQCVFETPPGMQFFDLDLDVDPAPSGQWVVTDEWSLRESH